jgi:hypothetical protein
VQNARSRASIPMITNGERQKRKRITAQTPRDENGNIRNAEYSLPPQKRINWQHPLLWPVIDASARRVGFLPHSIVEDLQRRFRAEGTYNSLKRSTVGGWIDRSSDPHRRWTDSVLSQVAKQSCWTKGIYIFDYLILICVF